MTITFDFSQSQAGITHTKQFYDSLSLEYVTEADFSGPTTVRSVTVTENDQTDTFTIGPFGDHYPSDVSAYRPGAGFIYSVSENPSTPFGFKIPISSSGFPDIRSFVGSSYSSYAALDADIQRYFDAWDAWDDAMNQKVFHSAEFGGLNGTSGIFTSTEPMTGLKAMILRGGLMDGSDIIIGSNFADTLHGEGGDDVFLGSNGGDTIDAGDGADTLDFRTATLSTGTSQTIHGGANVAGTVDKFLLAGSASEYRYSVQLGENWEGTQTVVQRISSSGQTLATFTSDQIEFSELQAPINNTVGAGNTIIEMTRQMLAVYTPSTVGATNLNWHPVSAMEMGILPSNFGGSTGVYTFKDGIYIHDAAGHDTKMTVLTGILDGKKTLSIAIAGSDDVKDFIVDLTKDFDAFYEKSRPLVDGLKKYISEIATYFESIIITGHSLGGAMVQHLISDLAPSFGATKISGFTFGSVGGSPSTVANSAGSVMNFIHENDITNYYYDWTTRAGSKVWINLPSEWLSNAFGEHFKSTYELSNLNLMSAANDSLSGRFYNSDLAVALRDGLRWSGSEIHIGLGGSNNDLIYSRATDQFVLGADGDDRVSLVHKNLVPSASRIIDGGVGRNSLLLGGESPEFERLALTDGGTELWWNHNGQRDLVGTYYRLQFLHFADVTVATDGTSLTTQRPAGSNGLSTQAIPTFTIDTAYDYADAGDGEMTVLGSASGDVIYAGAGRKTINGNQGDDLIIIKEVVGATGENQATLIDGGVGVDFMLGAAGDDTFIVDVAGDVAVGGAGVDTVVSSVSYRLSDEVEFLNLSAAAVDGFGNELDNTITGNLHANNLHGLDGNDTLLSGAGDDTLFGGSGQDILNGDIGSDTLNGGEGNDRAILAGLDGAGHAIFSFGGIIYAINRTDQSFDRIENCEEFADPHQTIGLSQIEVFDALAYGASYDDLAIAIRSDAAGLVSHYTRYGFGERREISFDAKQYTANYADLAAAFGGDTTAAKQHFLDFGVGEHRLAENPFDYVASFDDLITALKDLSYGEIRSIGIQHYQAYGFAEGRRAGVDFDVQQYLANYADLQSALGSDEDLAAFHFIKFGQQENRLWEDPLEYVASYGDLINAFGSATDEDIRWAALTHFRDYGHAEERQNGIGFDTDQYLANYDDLRAAFADGQGGYNEQAAMLHFIQHGFAEGRTDSILFV